MTRLRRRPSVRFLLATFAFPTAALWLDATVGATTSTAGAAVSAQGQRTLSATEPDTPVSVVQSTLGTSQPPRFDAQRLIDAIDAFHQGQHPDADVSSGMDLPIGFVRLALDEARDHFVLTARRTIEPTPSSGIGGVAVDSDWVFDKASLRWLSMWDGQGFGAPASNLRLMVPGQHTCAGYETEGGYSVVDVRRARVLLAGRLPDDLHGQGLRVEPLARARGFVLHLERVQPVPPGRRRLPRCDLGEPVMLQSGRMHIDCDESRQRCLARPVRWHASHLACTPIGSCD